MDRRIEQKMIFIKELAKYLVEHQVRNSCALEVGAAWAEEWASLRYKAPLFGYPTVDEAEKTLTEFLE